MGKQSDLVDYEALFIALPGPLMVMRADDPAFTLIAENQAHARLINPDELTYSIGKPLLDAFPDTSEEFKTTGRSTLVESIRRVVTTGLPDSMPDIRYDLADKNGNYVERWWRATHYPMKDNHGTVIQILQSTNDITARKTAEAELENVKTQFDALFNSTVLSIVRAEQDGTILAANETFFKTYGYTKTDLKKGINSRDLTPISSRQITIKIYEAVDKLGESQPVEKEYVRKDGTTFIGLVGAVRVPGTRQLIAFILDVTENKRLKEVNAAKDEFIALASHQLRTPATAVKQYLGLLLEGFAGDIDETQRGYLETANDSNNRELTIINDLLKTAQLDTQGYKLKPKQVDLNAIVKDIVDEFTPVCEMKHQTLALTHDGPLKAHVDVDETRVVLSNLIENAHKYSHGDTTIHIKIKKAGSYALITVRDEGVGIAETDLQSIFEKFTRVENPLSDVSGGNGLGLYWVKRIVTLHGGTMDVQSIIGEGTTFSVQLPL